MTIPLLIATLLALASFTAMWRHGRRGAWRSSPVWAQPLAAALFYLLLFPPGTRMRGDALTVLTPGTSDRQMGSLPAAQRVIALPGAPAPAAAEFAPDLATALRRHPSTGRLSVIGGGLPARDQPAAGGLALSFDAAPRQGLVELQSPQTVLLGAQWSLSGQVATAPALAARAELLDPLGAVADRVPIDREGSFRLSGLARGLGMQRFELRVLDADGSVLDRASLPLQVRPGHSLKLIVRAGAPDPELKYWRRWAADAGLSTQLAAGLSEGLALRDGNAQLTPEALASTDVVMLDERAWALLTVPEKAALQAAIQAGLGLLLRVTGPVEHGVAADWAALGFVVSATDAPHTVTLDRRSGLRERSDFTAAAVKVDAPDAAVLLRADAGEALAWWRSAGQGRIGLWTLADAYRLVLLGEPARYGTLWADTLGQLSRAQSLTPEPQLPANSWADERSLLCGLGEAAVVLDAEGAVSSLLVDEQHCAAWWPSTAGWHRLQTGGSTWPLYVRAPGDGEGLRRERDRRATERMVRAEPAAARPAASATAPLPRWPFFLGWLLLVAWIWWRERSIR